MDLLGRIRVVPSWEDAGAASYTEVGGGESVDGRDFSSTFYIVVNFEPCDYIAYFKNQ